MHASLELEISPRPSRGVDEAFERARIEMGYGHA
jgi:hypothetical protein